jgi:hypothetical protein
MTRILLCCIAAVFLLSGCSSEDNDGRPHCNGGDTYSIPGTTICSPVQVYYGEDEKSAVQARIYSAVRPNDGIVVDVIKDGDVQLSQGGITIVATTHDDNPHHGDIMVVAQDHWLPQDAADTMVADATKQQPDLVNRIALVISMIHDYQDTHPRIVTVTPTAAPQPVQPHGTLGWLVIVFRILISLAAGALLIIVSGPAWRLLCRIVWWTWRTVFYLVTRPSIWAARRRGRRNALAQRAIEQNRLVESNDSRGIYGNYPPAEVE